MKLLRSRVPYMSDEDWTKLVMRRAAEDGGPIEGVSRSELERIEMAQITLVKTKRLEELGFGMGVELNMDEGATTEISRDEVRAIRDAFRKNQNAHKLAEDFNVSVELIQKSVKGKIWPYAGGPLEAPVLSGLNVATSAYTTNQRRFIKGAVALAYREFDEAKFEIFCNNNGMYVREAKQLIQDLEKRDVRLNQQRFRGVLVRHSAGEDVEKCLVSYKRKARSPDRTAD